MPTTYSSHNSFADLFEVEVQEKVVAYIDGLRMGSWMRFINHSCKPNVQFEAGNVGREIRFFAVSTRKVRKVIIDYGYWAGM
jgi:SET domain-containing protein